MGRTAHKAAMVTCICLPDDLTGWQVKRVRPSLTDGIDGLPYDQGGIIDFARCLKGPYLALIVAIISHEPRGGRRSRYQKLSRNRDWRKGQPQAVESGQLFACLPIEHIDPVGAIHI